MTHAEGASSDELYCFDLGDFAVSPCGEIKLLAISHIYPFNSRLRVKPTVHRELSPSYVKYLITSITVNISPFNIVSTSIVSLWLGLEVFSYLAAHFPLLCTIHHWAVTMLPLLWGWILSVSKLFTSLSNWQVSNLLYRRLLSKLGGYIRWEGGGSNLESNLREMRW